MASSEVEICNSALIKIGAARILALTDDNDRARLCSDVYPRLRDKLLRSHPWNFAIERVQLALSTSVPAFGFSNKFAVPTDCLRILEINDGSTADLEYQKEGDYIVTDESQIFIKYIKKITDVSKYDKNFDEVLALEIAANIVYALTQSTTLKESLQAEAKYELSQARSFDAQEGTPQRVVANDFLNSRY